MKIAELGKLVEMKSQGTCERCGSNLEVAQGEYKVEDVELSRSICPDCQTNHVIFYPKAPK